MNTTSTHSHIRRLCEKIVRLNNALEGDDHIEDAEIELLNTYVQSLQDAVQSLKDSGVSTGMLEKEVVEKPTLAVQIEVEEIDETLEELEVSVQEVEEPVVEISQGSVEELKQEIEKQEEEQVFESEFSNEDPVSISTQEEVPDTIENEVEMEELGQLEDKSPVLAEDVADIDPSINDRFKERPNDLVDKLSAEPVGDLRQFLDLSQKYEFISQLFNGDVDHFNTALKRLNSSETYADAENYINTELLTRYDWKGKEKQVEKLTKLLHRRFHITSVGLN